MKPHRLLVPARIVLTLVLALGVLGLTSGLSQSSPALGKDKHGEKHNGKSQKPGKEKGHSKHDKKQQKHEGKHDNGKHKGKNEKRGKRVQAEPAALYTVTVDCTFDASTEQTSCLFDADSPAGAKRVNLFDVPAENLCSTVVGGDGQFVDPDPTTNVTGYRSTDSEGRMTLVIAGKVETGGSASYWIKAADDVFPAAGPGLVCVAQQAQSAAPTATTAVLTPASVPTATPTPLAPEVTDSTGSIVVNSYACPISTPQANYDWYGQCSSQPSGVRYRLLRIDTDTRDGVATSTDESGRARFANLQPGLYQLTQADGDWCYAQSDGVDADGNLNVTAGNRTSVWVFSCAG